MKILYIANARIPTEKAHGIQIMQMCKAFALYNPNAPNKIEIELVIPKRFNKIKDDPFEYYGIERNFRIKKLPCLDLIPLDKYIGHLGLWIESITFLLSVFFYTLFRKADILYTRDKLLLPLVLFKRNLIYEAHTFPKHYFLYSLFLKKIKGIIVITQKLKELFVKRGIQENKILTAPDGVDLEKFDIKESKDYCRRKLNLPPDKKIVLYTGHLYKWKGATALLEAARKSKTKNQKPKILFVFVGGTEKDIESLKKKAQNLNNVLIAGHKLHSEIPYWLKAADVLVLPNSGKEDISRYWTSPIKLFEYMASKKPIIASDLPSLREILNEGNAILVKPDDPEELAEGIKKALESPGLADKISKMAFQDVQGFTWQKRAEKILRFLVFS